MKRSDRKKPRFITRTVERVITDMNTGLITEEKIKYSAPVVNSDKYAMTYEHAASLLTGIKSRDAILLALFLSYCSEYDTNKVLMTPDRRRVLAWSVGVHVTNLSKLLKILEDNGVLNRIRGEIYLNPYMFWRGTSSSRSDYIKSFTEDEQDALMNGENPEKLTPEQDAITQSRKEDFE